jgi:hypothetical protein
MSETKAAMTLQQQLEAAVDINAFREVLKESLAGLGGAVPECEYEDVIIDNGYDTAEAMETLTWVELTKIGIRRGHAERVLKLLAPFAARDGEDSDDAESLAKARPFGMAWPTSGAGRMPTPSQLDDWGVFLVSHIRIYRRVLSQRVAAVLHEPWADLPGSYVHGSLEDAWLSQILGTPGGVSMPAIMMEFVRGALKAGHGMRVLHTICRQVKSNTDDAITMLKDKVRKPTACTKGQFLSIRMCEMDQSRLDVEAAGYDLDANDLKSGYKNLVAELAGVVLVISNLERDHRKTAGGVSVEELVEVLKYEGTRLAVKYAQDKENATAHGAAVPARTDFQGGDDTLPVCPGWRFKGECLHGSGMDTCSERHSHPPELRSSAPPPSCHSWRRNGSCVYADKCAFEHAGVKGECAGVACSNLFSVLARVAAMAAPADKDKKNRKKKKIKSKQHVMAAVDADAITRSITESIRGLCASSSVSLGRFLEFFTGVRQIKCSKPSKQLHQQQRTASLTETSPKVRFYKDGKRIRRRKGPVSDTGATLPVVCKSDMDLATDVHDLPRPIQIGTANKVTSAVVGASLPVVGGLMDVGPGGVLLEGATESLCPTNTVCSELGYGYLIDCGGAAARFFHPTLPSIECEKDGDLFRLPWADYVACCVVPWAAHVGSTAHECIQAAFPATQPSWYDEHGRRGHPFRADCPHCVRGRLRTRQAFKKGEERRESAGGYTMSADYSGPHAPDIDGNIYGLIACVYGYTDDPDDKGAESAYGLLKLVKTRGSAAAATAFEEFEAELKRLGRDKSRQIIRLHTDVDKSFRGSVDKLVKARGWLQTDTGGYRARANSVCERRIGMLKQSLRTVLLAATGGYYYYEQLWGPGFEFCNRRINWNDWKLRRAPHQMLTGSDHEYTASHCPFGCYVLFHVPEENRDGTFQQVAEHGIYLYDEPTSQNGIVVSPITWDVEQDGWVLGASTVVTTWRTYDHIFPLAMKPGKLKPEHDFDAFIDRVFEPMFEMDGNDAAGSESDT